MCYPFDELASINVKSIDWKICFFIRSPDSWNECQDKWEP